MSYQEALGRIEKAEKKKATELDLSNLELKEIPFEIEKLTSLMSLRLDYNQITEIKGLDKLTSMTELWLGSNRITEIKGLEQLTSMTSLSLSSNQITEIKGLEQLTSMTELWLYSNRITEIKGLEQLTSMMSLSLHSNRITEIKGLEQLTSMTSLSLHSNQITEIKGLDKLTSLTELWLGSNQITEIKGLEQLTSMTSLRLDSNRITEIKGLEQLTSMTELWLHSNQITEIKGLEQLTSMTSLWLHSNRITEIKGLDKLTSMTSLSLNSNRITEIKGLDKLTSMTSLSLNSNRITEIKGLDELIILKKLNLSYNKIEQLQSSVLLLQLPIKWTEKPRIKGSGVNLYGNPIPSHLVDMIEPGPIALARHLNKTQRISPETRYKEKIYSRYNLVRIFGMSEPILLKNLYVRVRILKKITEQTRVKPDDLSQFLQWENRTFGDKKDWPTKSGYEVANEHEKFIVLGKPGAGKTTLLKHLALMSLDGSSELKKKRLPIFISLKEFADKQVILMDFIAGQFEDCEFENASAFLTKKLKEGHCQILLDGLDEVNKEHQNGIIQQIIDFSNKYGNNQYIISCRVAAYNHSFEQFTDVEIADFDDEQIETFVNNWFRKEEEVAKSCWEKIKASKQLNELATSPLLLTLLCLVYDDLYDFPINRAQLYKEAIDALLKKWDAFRRIDRDGVILKELEVLNKKKGEQYYKKLPLKRKESMFANIAVQSFIKSEYFFEEKVLLKYIEEYIENLPQFQGKNLQFASFEVLRDIEVQHGIFVPRAKGIHSFSHLTFHEYFAAKNIAENASKTSFQLLVDNMGDPKWREVILLTVNMLGNADQLILMMKEKIDGFVKEEEIIRELLNVISSDITSSKYRMSSVKAFRVWFAVVNAIGNFELKNSHVFNVIKGTQIYLARKIINVLDPKLGAEFELAINRTPSDDAIVLREILLLNELGLNDKMVLDLKNDIDKIKIIDRYLSLNLIFVDCLNTEIYLPKSTREKVIAELFTIPS